MAIFASSEGNSNNFSPVPAGTHIGRCYSMIHIGTAPELYMGQEKVMNKVRISFELPTELKEFKEGEGEKPMSISKDFTLSMHEKSTLRKMLEGWRGKVYTEEEARKVDLTKLLGQPCMLTVVHKEKQGGGGSYATINSISGLPKGIPCPPQVNDTFEWNYDNFNQAKFDKIPDFIKDRMRQTNEYKKAVAPHNQEVESQTSNNNIDDDDLGLPF